MAVTWHIRRTTGRVSLDWLIRHRLQRIYHGLSTAEQTIMLSWTLPMRPSIHPSPIRYGFRRARQHGRQIHRHRQLRLIGPLKVRNRVACRQLDISPPNGTPIGLVSDKVGFQFNNLSAFPSAHIGASPAANPIVHSRGGDWASSTPSTIVILADILDFAGSESAVSSDGGSTWTKWTTTPAGVPTTYPGGSLAASTGDKLGSSSVLLYSACLVYD